VLGQSCFIQNYVDADPSGEYADFSCGKLSYNGHKGTDIALPAARDMADGVDVLAAAAGTVRAIRDGVGEHLPGEPMQFPEGQDCGNGLAITHADGWETQYCHLRKGSVSVSAGDVMKPGQKVGEIGMSGRTEFPHLHMTLRRDGVVVDPFDPTPDETCGAPVEDQLWADPLSYQAGGLLQAGFFNAVPEFDTIKTGDAHSPNFALDSGALVFWAHVFGTKTGDHIRLTIDGPNGRFFDNTSTLDKPQAQAMRAGGRRLHDGNKAPGTYTGTATFSRQGAVIGQISIETVLSE
jgi:hypothetical protein